MSTNFIPCMYVPTTINTGLNDKIYFRRAITAPLTASITPGIYHSPHVLVASATAAMNTAAAGSIFAGSFSPTTGKFTWTWSSLSFQMLTPTDPAKASAHELLGWRSGSQDPATHISPITSSNQIANYWTPGINVGFDSFDTKNVEGVQSTTMDGNHQFYFIGSTITRQLSFNLVPIYKVLQSQTGTLYFSQSFEEIWHDAKTAVNYWSDRSLSTTYGQYFVMEPTNDLKVTTNKFTTPALLDFDIVLGKLGDI